MYSSCPAFWWVCFPVMPSRKAVEAPFRHCIYTFRCACSMLHSPCQSCLPACTFSSNFRPLGYLHLLEPGQTLLPCHAAAAVAGPATKSKPPSMQLQHRYHFEAAGSTWVILMHLVVSSLQHVLQSHSSSSSSRSDGDSSQHLQMQELACKAAIVTYQQPCAEAKESGGVTSAAVVGKVQSSMDNILWDLLRLNCCEPANNERGDDCLAIGLPALVPSVLNFLQQQALRVSSRVWEVACHSSRSGVVMHIL